MHVGDMLLSSQPPNNWGSGPISITWFIGWT